MSKIYYEALSKIPKRFIDDKTVSREFEGKVIIANGRYAPMIYRPTTKRWKFIDITSIKPSPVFTFEKRLF